MSSVDDRIVNMQFNSKQFTQGAADSQKSLASLESALSKTAQSPGLDKFGNSVQQVSTKFSALQVAGVTAVATIANKAVNAGLKLLKSLTIDPILQGYQEYQTNLNSIQTVMANTGKSVGVVNAALGQLNTYSDKTIYNFSQMAHNVGTFSAAGVKLHTAVSAIQGISNLAALSGSSAQQASNAMYQLSQAIAASRVNLQDWNSVVNAGMGGRNFQKALLTTAEAMGKIDRNSVSMGKSIKVAGQSFRESISARGGKTWLDSDVLVKTLNLLDGRLSQTALKDRGFSDQQVADQLKIAKARLRAQGYLPKEIEYLQKQAEEAYKSATVVKTIPQLVDTTQQAIGSIFTNSFQNIFGTFKQSSNYLTNFSHGIQNATGSFSQFLNGTKKLNGHDGILTTFNKLSANDVWQGKKSSGRIDVVVGLSHVFIALGKVVRTVGKALSDVFPNGQGGIGNALVSMAANFRKFSNAIQPSAKTLDELRSVFGGLFAVLHIGFTILKAVGALFGGFFGAILKNSGGASGGLLAFAAHLGEMLKAADKFITSGGKLVDVFGKIGTVLGGLAGKGISAGANVVFGIINGILGSGGQIKKTMEDLGNNLIEWFKAVLGIHSPAQAMIPLGENIVHGIAVGIAAGVVAVIKAMGLIIKAVLGAITGELFGGMSSLDFASVLNAFLTTGVLALILRFAHILNKGFGSIAQVMNQLTETLQTMQHAIQAEAIKQIAIAIGILVGSLLVLSLLNFNKVKIGIGAISLLMGELVLAFKLMSGIGAGVDKETGAKIVTGAKNMLIMATAMDAMATAVLILSAAVAALGALPFDNLKQGMGAVTLLLGEMILSVKGLAAIGPAAEGAAGVMLAMAVAVDLLTGSVLAMALIPFSKLIKGVAVIGIVLAELVLSLTALSAFAPEVTISGLALIGLSIALNILTVALVAMAALSWDTIWSGLEKLGVVLAALAVASLIAEPLAALAIPLLALGAAFALAGTGMFLFGTGFAILAATGAAGTATLIATINALIAVLPAIAQQVAAAFITIIQVVANAMPKLRDSFDKIFVNFVGVITDNIPVIAGLIQRLITTAINVIKKSIPQWVEMGFTIIDKFIKSAAKHVPQMASNGLKLVRGLIDAVAANIGGLADSAAKLIIAYINAIANAINNNVDGLRNAGINMALAIANGLSGGLLSTGVDLVKHAAESIADHLPGWMKKVLHIHSPSRVMWEIGQNVAQGLALGIDDGQKVVENSATSLALRVTSSMQKQSKLLSKTPLSWGEQIATAIAAGIKGAQVKILGALYDTMALVQAQGNATVAKVARQSILAQKNADLALAKANLDARAAAQADRIAGKKGATKAQKLRARKLDTVAKRSQSTADALQAQADAKAQALQDAQDIVNNEQSGDFNAAGDIYAKQSNDLARQAQQRLAKANAEVAAARKLSGKARQAMLQLARDDAAAAARIAQASATAQNNANLEYQKSLQARLDAYDQMIADEAWQKAFDAADAPTQAAMLQKRAAEEQQKAADAQAAADAARLEAQKQMATDAAAAADLLTTAEQKAQEAKAAADAAKQDTDAANQLLGQTSFGGSSVGGAAVTPSKSVLEQAARVIDDATASMLAAEQAALADHPPVQFIQNNTSPKALSPSEVYRQTNNLLSNAEIKMGPT